MVICIFNYKKRILDKKIVCFSCATAYHIFVSYILSKTVYKNNYKIILLSDYRREVRKAYENLNKVNIWNEIILINDNDKKNVIQQLKKINFKKIDILHYFTYGSLYNSILLNFVRAKTKIILTDEGLMTYYVKESCEYYKKKYKMLKNPIPYCRISEIWLFDKRLYISKLKKPLKDIEFKKYINSDFKFEICDDLNRIFDYEYKEIDWNILFFDQPLTFNEQMLYKEERVLLQNILKEMKDYNGIFIKKHPRDSNSKYADLNINILAHEYIPWEVVYLNEYIKNKSKIQDKIYMSYDSTAFFNICIIFKDFGTNNNFILLKKILSNYVSKTEIDKVLEKYYQKFKQIYEIKLHEPKLLEELKKILNNIYKTK